MADDRDLWGGGVHATNVEPLPSLEGLAAEYMARYSSQGGIFFR